MADDATIEIRYEGDSLEEFSAALDVLGSECALLDVSHYRVPGSAFLLVNRERANHVAGILRRAGMIQRAAFLEVRCREKAV